MILNSPSIYKLGGGGGGYKDLGEIVDQSTLTIPNNSYVTIDNYSQSSITVDVETADGEIPNAVIIVNNEVDNSTISITVNGNPIAINSGSSNILADGTQYQITVLGNAYTVTGLTQPSIVIPTAYKQVQYHELTGNGNPSISANNMQYVFKMNSSKVGDYIKIRFDLVLSNGGDEAQFRPFERSINGGINSITISKWWYGGLAKLQIKYYGVYNTPGYAKVVDYDDTSYLSGIKFASQWGDTYNNTFMKLNNSQAYQCGNKANLESWVTLFACYPMGGSSMSDYAGTKLYYVTIKDKMNLIPVVRIGDSKNGWYDTVTGNFATPVNDNSITPGPDV